MLLKIGGEAVLASLGAAVQRAMPILMGAMVLRLAGDAALHAQNTVYVAITLCNVVTTSGLVPHMLRARSAQPANAELPVLNREAFIYEVLFAMFILGYFAFWNGSGASYLLLAATMFFYGRMAMGLSLYQANARYLRAFLIQVLYLALSLSTAAVFLVLGFSGQTVFEAAYLIASLPILLFLWRNFPILGLSRQGITRFDVREIASYTSFGVLATGLTFLIFDVISSRLDISRFNELIFAYQIYAIMIFIPSVLTVIVVPRSTRAGVSSLDGVKRLPGYYGLGALLVVVPTLAILPLLYRFYGLHVVGDWWSLFALVGAAIPSAINAAFNQISIILKQTYVPVVAAAGSAATILLLLATFVPPGDFGYALLAGSAVSLAISAGLTVALDKRRQRPRGR